MAAAPICAGTNACYAENVSRVKTLPVGYKSNGPLMLINTEWGNFSSPVLPRLDEDLCAFSPLENHLFSYPKLSSGAASGVTGRKWIMRHCRVWCDGDIGCWCPLEALW